MVETVYRVFLAGEGKTGKTEIFKRFTGYSFAPGPTRAFNVAQRSFEELDISIQLLDLSGRKAYSDLREAFFQNVSAGILVFDLSDKVTMFLLQDWLREIYSAYATHSELPPLFIVGNKVDLREEGKRCLSSEEVWKFIERLKAKFKHDIKYLEVSAKNNTGITELIKEIAGGIKQVPSSESGESKEQSDPDSEE